MQNLKIIHITGLNGSTYTVEIPIKKNKHGVIIQDYNYVYEKVPLQDYAIWFMQNRNEPSRFILYRQLEQEDNFKIIENYCKEFCTTEQFGQLTKDHKLYMFCYNLKTFEVCPHCNLRSKSIRSYKLGYAGSCGVKSCMNLEAYRITPKRNMTKMKLAKARQSKEQKKEYFNKGLQTNIDRHGTEEEKLNRNNIKSPMQVKNSKDNRQKTWNGKYKDGHPMRDPKCIEKKKQTSLLIYDKEYPMQNKNIRDKIINSKIKNGTLVSPRTNSEIKIINYSDKLFETQGYSDKSLNDIIRIGYTVLDIQTEQKCSSIKYLAPDNIIRNYTPDIYIDSEKLYIETKSSYWLGQNPDFILCKLLGCLEQGYNIVLDVKEPNGSSILRISFQSNSNNIDVLKFIEKIQTIDNIPVKHIKMNENIVKNKFELITLLLSKLSKEMLSKGI
jgi:hypothetical protein